MKHLALPFGMTIGDIPVALSVMALASFTAGIIHNAGFEAALDIEPGHMPITLADHSMSTLLWLPPIVIAGVVLASVEFAGRRLGGMKSDEEVISTSKNPEKTAILLSAIHAFSPWSFVALGVYSLLSNGETQIGILVGACASIWMLFAGWSLRRDTPVNAWLWYGFVLGPAVSICLFGFGWSAAVRALQSEPSEVTSVADGTVHRVTILRAYENGILYRTDTKIVFTRWDAISELRMHGRTDIWRGMRCSLSGCVPARPAPRPSGGTDQ